VFFLTVESPPHTPLKTTLSGRLPFGFLKDPLIHGCPGTLHDGKGIAYRSDYRRKA